MIYRHIQVLQLTHPTSLHCNTSLPLYISQINQPHTALVPQAIGTIQFTSVILHQHHNEQLLATTVTTTCTSSYILHYPPPERENIRTDDIYDLILYVITMTRQPTRELQTVLYAKHKHCFSLFGYSSVQCTQTKPTHAHTHCVWSVWERPCVELRAACGKRTCVARGCVWSEAHAHTHTHTHTHTHRSIEGHSLNCSTCSPWAEAGVHEEVDQVGLGCLQKSSHSEALEKQACLRPLCEPNTEMEAF